MPFARKYNTLLVTGATAIRVPIIKRAVVDFALSADWTPAAGDVKISIDATAAANVTNLPTAITYGNTAMWEFILTAAELTCKQAVITIADSATKAVEDQAFSVETFGNASAMYVIDPTLASLGLVLAKTTNITGLNDIAATAVVSSGAITTAGGAVSTVTAVGSVTGAVGSVTGAVGSVTGAVGSVTGAVGSVAGNVGGNVTGSVGSIATGGIAAASLSTAAKQDIADYWLDRNMATGVDSGTDTTEVRTPRQALRALRNKTTIAAGTATVTKENDVTASWTAAVTTTAGNPISEVDPS